MVAIILLAVVHTGVSATVYIRLNLKDSVASHAVLKRLESMKTVDKVTFILPEKNSGIQPDGLGSKAAFMYNTDFYNYLGKELQYGRGNVLFILNSVGSVIYQAPLDSINYDAIHYFTRYDDAAFYNANHPDDFGFYHLGRTHDHIVLTDKNSRLLVGNMHSKKMQDIPLTEELIQDMYRPFYGKYFDTIYPNMRAYMVEFKSFLPDVNSAILLNNNELLVEYYIRNRVSQGLNAEISMHSSFVLHRLDSPQKHTILTLPEKAAQESNGIYTRNFVMIHDTVYIRFHHTLGRQRSSFLRAIHVDTVARQIIMDEAKIENYYSRNLFSVMNAVYSNLCYASSKTIGFQYDDSLYDFDLKKLVGIPFIQNQSDGKEQHQVHFTTKNPFTQQYHIVYNIAKEKVYRNMIFTIEGSIIRDEKIENTEGRRMTFLEFVHPYRMLFVEANDPNIKWMDL